MTRRRGGLRFVLAMAGRESRGSRRRLPLLVGALAAGVAALVAINSFTANLRRSVREQSRALLGADLSLSSRQRPSPAIEALLDSIACGGATPCAGDARGRVARVTSFAAMAYVPRTAGARLVQVAAIEGGYPFYGEIRTDPPDGWRRLQTGLHALVDPALLAAIDAVVGDTLLLGEGRFVIAGTLVNFPGEVGIRSAFGPRVVIPGRYLAETKLLGFGARARYEAFVKLPSAGDAERLAARYRPRLAAERVRVRTVAEDQSDLEENLGRLGRYLGLVGLVALLLGGLGVGSTVHAYIRQRMETVAVLRCLGASTGRLLAVYLVQAGALGLLGGVVGAAAGAALQFALPSLLGDFLPVDVTVRLSWPALLAGVGMGLWVALAFALLPLLAVRRIPPLAALRRPYEAESPAAPRDRWRWGAGAALGASVAGLAVLQAGHWRTGLLFAGAVGIALLLLWLAALGLIRAARRWSPARGSYLWRQGLANLHRPANQTVVVVLALGFGAFLLATLLVVQQNLLREIRLTGGPRRPNLVVFDVQTDQARAVTEVLRRAGVEPSPAVPIVPMRIASVNGAPTSRLLVQGTDGHAGDDDGPSGWALRREYRSTYRDTTVASERLVAGTWWRGDAPATGAVPISLEAGIAAELGVAPGDTITWDVQGVRIASVVANLREVDWARFEPNFFVVFPPGPLDRAPQTLVLLARVEDVAARARLQRQVVEAAPNVSVLDLTQIQESLERLLGKVVLAIRFMALFSLLAGLVVLAGAIAANRFQRVREAVLLKTLGATRRQIAVIVLAEHLALGGLAAIVALGLAGLAGWGLMRFVFETDFALPLGPLLGLGLGVAALTASVGLWNGSEAVRQTPLEALREQG